MRISPLILGVSLLALAACGSDFDRELGADANGFGNATMNNTLIQSGQKDYTIALGNRFSSEVPSTITFAFNSSQLDSNAVAILRQQADWIKTFPEVRFRVYGHTDLVGSNASNQALGLRRAKAVVAYFASQGISRSRLEAMTSYGETRPVVQTDQPEQQNRRTMTEVSGFVKNHPSVLNGKYAQVIHREYLVLAERKHPRTTNVTTQVAAGG
ncbi:Outer membrane protein OmpA [Pseudorhodobacter antarcticus]|uniref:Outer membrane protein OmpA n=1 Tax=Pseudorhodobacter antarcticus TaxID=1077947 RepID=A0A1H8CST7_9RHOB|nr:OmpA family protein [Pseudorhodobacter antarcticus]SEM97514.1 Outer membrane protein OmpA [Pseudorhodobacter antarcticus]